MKPAEFREELIKIMPGYEWTVHKTGGTVYLKATGIQSSGFNRVSTLQVERWEESDGISDEAKSSGFGKRAPWLWTAGGPTLATALRSLQVHYENMACTYRAHASYLKDARKGHESLPHGCA
jgi:hypothetical protein